MRAHCSVESICHVSCLRLWTGPISVLYARMVDIERVLELDNDSGISLTMAKTKESFARHGKGQPEEANMVMGKLVKAVNDNNRQINRSAFAHTCIKSAWENVHEKKVQAYARR